MHDQVVAVNDIDMREYFENHKFEKFEYRRYIERRAKRVYLANGLNE